MVVGFLGPGCKSNGCSHSSLEGQVPNTRALLKTIQEMPFDGINPSNGYLDDLGLSMTRIFVTQPQNLNRLSIQVYAKAMAITDRIHRSFQRNLSP